MHLVLAFLGAVITILILLNRLNLAGLDLASLNPFLWHRRRKWSRKYHADPVYSLEKPVEAVGLLVTAVAKVDGDVSLEEKKRALDLFQEELKLSDDAATSLLTACVFLLKDGVDVGANIEKVLAPSLPAFTQEQAESTIYILKEIAAVGGTSERQRQIIDGAQGNFDAKFTVKADWA